MTASDGTDPRSPGWSIPRELPPPEVAGQTPTPYPWFLPSILPELRCAPKGDHRSSECRARELLLAQRLDLALGQSGWVAGVRGLRAPLVRRDPGGVWRVTADGAKTLAERIQRTGIAFSDAERSRMSFRLTSALRGTAEHMSWYASHSPPPIARPLLDAFEAILCDRDVHGPAYAGERAYWATRPIPRWRRSETPAPPWESRPPRWQVDADVALSGRVAPYRLRPVVLVEYDGRGEGALRAGWVVCDAPGPGKMGAMLGMLAPPVGGGHASWHAAVEPAPIPPQVHPGTRGWFGPRLNAQRAYHEVRCAVTDRVLVRDAMLQAGAAEWLPEAFPAVPLPDATPNDWACPDARDAGPEMAPGAHGPR